MDSNGARVTQRAPQSCQRCSMKKMRCSKTVPCEACANSGMALQCRREQVIVTKQIRFAKAQHQKSKRNSQANATPRIAGQEHTQSIDNPPLHPSDDHEATATTLLNFAQQASAPELGREAIFSMGATGVTREMPTPNPTHPTQSMGRESWAMAPDLESPESTQQEDVSPFEHTATSLEYLVWGRQRDTGLMPASVMVAPQGNVGNELLTPQQATEILRYHCEWLTWTHNIIHWPHFREECQVYWSDGYVKEKAWLALYYGVLCIGLHHMPAEQCMELGLHTGPDVAEQLYHKCVDALKEADYAAIHSLRSVQAICLLVLCAHDFNGSNLLSVLLSAAIRIAQALNVHRLGPDPVEPLPHEEAVRREIQKSIWLFLSTQDWFLIPFSNAHSISPNYCTTPIPTNCNIVYGLSGEVNPLKSHPMEEPTQMSYQIIMHRVANVFRAFFDDTSCLPAEVDQDVALRRLYDHVLRADSEMREIIKSLPRYLRRETPDNGQLPRYIPRQRYHFTISVAHKTLTIHRRFFLKSLTDKWYNYTRVTCVNCARTILTQFRSNSNESTAKNLWTVLAHVVSASIILLLELIFSDDDSDDTAIKRQLVCDCLDLLKISDKSSTMSVRGIDLIELLLSYTQPRSPGTPTGTNRLDLKEIAAYLAMDKSKSFTGSGMSGSTFNFNLGELDEWMQSFDMPFDPLIS